MHLHAAVMQVTLGTAVVELDELPLICKNHGGKAPESCEQDRL